MKERTRFVLEWERRWDEGEGIVNMSELCREFGISRECGYKWLKRYRDAGNDLKALEERSRRPRASPHAVPETVQDVIVEARKLKPRWGPLKLRGWLSARFPGVAFPGPSTIAAILKRRGLVRPPKRRRRVAAVAGVVAPFPACEGPNVVWCVDFKGWFHTRDGRRCYPLTILDAYSRYVIRCEGVSDPDGIAVLRIFDSAFQEFGRPQALRSDNGSPFASTGAGGLTSLSVWLLQLGITLQRIAPGNPQQNGRQERMHRTMKLEAELDAQPQADLRAQQRAFDEWRREYNQERPHQALNNRTPASVYFPSSRRYPCKRITPEPDAWSGAVKVEKDGFIRLQRRRFFISTALKHLFVELELIGPEQWEVSWGGIILGRLDWRRDDRGIIVPRRKRGQVSTISLK